MGVIGEFAGDVRPTVNLILAVLFVIGLVAFLFSKWIEPGGIKQGSELVRKMIDVDINPRYASSKFKIKWTVRAKEGGAACFNPPRPTSSRSRSLPIRTSAGWPQ